MLACSRSQARILLCRKSVRKPACPSVMTSVGNAQTISVKPRATGSKWNGARPCTPGPATYNPRHRHSEPDAMTIHPEIAALVGEITFEPDALLEKYLAE